MPRLHDPWAGLALAPTSSVGDGGPAAEEERWGWGRKVFLESVRVTDINPLLSKLLLINPKALEISAHPSEGPGRLPTGTAALSPTGAFGLLVTLT